MKRSALPLVCGRLLATPRHERMPCTLLHGDSNIGNTQIIAKFRRAHTDEFDEGRGVEMRPIISMQMPPTPDQHRFHSALPFEIGAPHNAAASLAVLERLARDLLRRMDPSMLIVDEVHHLLAGTYGEQRAALNLLKFLANDLRASIALVGTNDAVIALQSDTHMVSRFTPFAMPRWRESETFRRLPSAFARILPLRRPSDLAQREIAQYVLTASDGLTGGCPVAMRIAHAVRSHWRIENAMHWVLDVAFGEDQCRVRVEHAVQNFAIPRRITMNLLRKDTQTKAAPKSAGSRPPLATTIALNSLAGKDLHAIALSGEDC